MAKEKVVDKEITLIKKLIKENKVIIGADRVLKNLKAKKLEKVFLSSNCRKKTALDIERYSDLTSTAVVKLNYPNDELGIICKKQFSISVIGIIR